MSTKYLIANDFQICLLIVIGCPLTQFHTIFFLHFDFSYRLISNVFTLNRAVLQQDRKHFFWNVPFQYVARKGAIC